MMTVDEAVEKVSRPPLDIPQLDQSLYYREPLREFDHGPHDPYGDRRRR